MSHFFLFLILFWYYRIIDALGCAIPSQPKTRVFDTFEHYRGNKVPFRPSEEGWQGSNVEFTFKTINTLPKNVFVTYDSESVITLKLSGKQIKEIEDGAFMSLSCLQELFLDHNNITKIPRNIFPNRVQRLDLSYNQVEILNNSTFANLFRLRELNLGSNRIKKVEILAFINLTLLEYLNLENNQIKEVPDDLFRPVPHLTSLILSWNRFEDLDADKWGDLGKLQKLELAGTDLNRFDPTRVPFTNLKSVNLSSNSLTFLNVTVLKRHYPKLELIDLNNNLWICDDLEGIIRDLNASNIKVPSGDFSHVGINGIACSETSQIPILATAASTSTTKISGVCVERDELERYVQKEIKKNNEELGGTIASIRTFTILTFSLLWIFIILEILYRTNVCGIFPSRTRRSEGFAEESNDTEDFRLLHMKES